MDDRHEQPSIEIEPLADDNRLPGVIAELGELQPASIITEDGLARLFQRHVVSVKRAIKRGELPPPCPLFGAKVWTVGAIIRYIEGRLEQAAQETERESQRLNQLSPLPQRSRRSS